MDGSIEKKAIEARKKYQKQWRSQNKDRVKEYNRRYWERKAQTALASEQGDNGNNDRKDAD